MLSVVVGSVGAYQLTKEPVQAMNPACVGYSCAPASYIWPSNGVCIIFNTYNIMQPCADPAAPYCNTTSGFCTAAPKPDPAQEVAWPGEQCNNVTLPCKFGNCLIVSSKHPAVCVGTASGGACTLHDQCQPGLHCSQSNVCAPQIANLGIGCQTDFDCVNSAACNMTFTPNNGTCYTVGSLELGSVVTDCIGGVSYLCQTGICINTNFLKRTGYCTKAPISVVSMPQNCTSDSDCVGTNGLSYFLSSCECGYNVKAAAYCQLFLGDPPGVQMLSTWRNALANSSSCNTVRRMADGCLKSIGLYQTVGSATYYYEHYAQIQMNDNCVQKIINSVYWVFSTAGFLLYALPLIFTALD